jgi:DNA-binding SARP family transcriptional activator/streptogramin lyase
MEFRILGPVEVVDGGCVVPLGPSRQRALLALLLLHANDVVSRDRLIDDLWGERAPETAAASLHTYVSQLRKVLKAGNDAEPRVLVTRTPGYVIEVDPERVDLKRFELLAGKGKRHLVAGDAAAAAGTLAEALSLWRGPPLQEFGSVPFALAERLRLEDLGVSALEDRLEADLALGRHQELIAELEALTREHPFRERLQSQLMLAFYRSGRQAEALETYRKTRRRLAEELGIEPGPALQELEQAILNHDTTLRPPSAAEKPSADRRRIRGRALAIAALVALGLTLGLALSFDQAPPASIQLTANSVGFIDAESGRVTRSYPVGRQPSALTVADNAVWVANYQDQTVTRIDRSTGHSVTIPVGGHPTGLAADRGTIWAWTLEADLVPIDSRYDTAGRPLSFAAQTVGARSEAGAGRTPEERQGGRVIAGGGFLWITVPLTTVIRVDPVNLQNRQPFVPDAGVEGAIVYRDGKAWVAGSDEVFPITAVTGIAGSGVPVGIVRDLAFGANSLWVVSGGPTHPGGVVQGLRRVDPETRLIQETISVGSDPVSVAAAGGSIWVAARTDGLIERVDPTQNRVVEKISAGAAKPTSLAADSGGLWVAVD